MSECIFNAQQNPKTKKTYRESGLFHLPMSSTSVELSISPVLPYHTLHHSSNKILRTFSFATQPRKKHK